MVFGQQLFQSRTDGQPMNFEWKIFTGLTTMGILNQIQQMMGKLQCEPGNFTGRIFTSMFNDIVWDAKGNDEKCENNSKTMKRYARGFPRGHWSFLRPGSEKKWCGTYDHKPDGSWDLFNISHSSSTCCDDGEEDAGTEGRRKNCGKI